mgnify:CR=1 FL=1|tara:strand:- start:160 stop:426 length:267 start_codon:yes stop_codon:yes gene_type:complete
MAAIKNIINNLFYTDVGRILLSIIIGLGIASLFRQICDSKDCYKFIGPEHNNIKNQIFSYDSDKSKCFLLNRKNVQCNQNKKNIYFAE